MFFKKIKKCERTKHCDICKKCIINFDHHCYYIDNCVGKKNNTVFFFFIFYLTVFILFLSIIQALILSKKYFLYDKNLDCFLIFLNWKNDEFRENVHFYFILSYLVLSLFFYLSSCFLFFLSARAFFSGITTYERIKKKYVKNDDSEEFLSYVSISDSSFKNKKKRNLSMNSTELNEDKNFEKSLIDIK